MNKIKLGSIVAVSDPCYEKPELKLDNVLSGNYVPVVRHLSLEDWGNRIGALVCVHESFFGNELTWWEHDAIGVDSGQAGVFSMDTYQNDEKVKGLTPYDFKGGAPDIEDFWYRVCCNMTIGEPGWGTYDQGVVSSSGLGDGCYDVYVAKHKGMIVGIHIDFGLHEDPDFHFYLTP
jgi:hypothetical protein